MMLILLRRSNCQIDNSLKVLTSGDSLDIWWNYIFKSERYPCLSKVVKAALSIFTGPQIETFNMMNDIIDKRSSRMGIATYGAIMNVKHDLIAKGHSLFSTISP